MLSQTIALGMLCRVSNAACHDDTANIEGGGAMRNARGVYDDARESMRHAKGGSMRHCVRCRDVTERRTRAPLAYLIDPALACLIDPPVRVIDPPVRIIDPLVKWRHDSILLQIFKVVREARNKGRAEFKLNQKKAQTKECSKQVTVNGDIFHQMASEREIPNATLETIPEEQTPLVSAVEHPQDESYKSLTGIVCQPSRIPKIH